MHLELVLLVSALILRLSILQQYTIWYNYAEVYIKNSQMVG